MRDVLSTAKSRVTTPVRPRHFRSNAAPRVATRFVRSALLPILLAALVSLCGCGVTYNNIPLQVDPGSVSFGTVMIGGSQTTNVTLRNVGLFAVPVSGMTVGDTAFTLSSAQLPSSIAPGGSASFQVTFAPASAKAYSSQISVASQGKKMDIPVDGSGQQNSAPQPPPAPTAALEVSATALEFGSVTLGSVSQQSLTLTSSGSAPLQISSLNAGGSFTAQAPTLPLTLQPGQTLNLPVQFAPSAAGSVTGQLVIASNAAASPSVNISLDGSGASSAAPPPPPVPPAPGTPALTLSSTAIDFGSAPVGSQTPSSVTLTSSGTVAVTLQSAAVSGDGFSAGQLQLPLTLQPGQQVSLPLTFTPSSVGSTQGQVILTDDATGSANTIALTGTGVAAASPSLSISPGGVDFGDVTVSTNAFKVITLVANGSVPVTVNSVVVAGASFSSAVQGLPRTLQPSQQMSVQVKFDPAAEGNATGTVTVSSNSAGNATSVVSVRGNGVAPAVPSLAGSASSLSFGKVTVGAQATKVVTVTSTGTAPASITGGSLTGTGYSATYAGVPVGSLSSPITLQPGQQVNFNVAFDPTKVGASSGQLSLATDTGSPVDVSLTGMGTAAASPALTLSATSLDFGDVQVNAQSVLQLTLTSSGTAPVTISSSAIAGKSFQIASVAYPAGINGWPATLNPGQQITLSLTFAPETVGAATGSLTVNSDASGGTASVALSGTGDAVPAAKLTLSTTSLSFGPTPIGSKVSRTVTLTSSGGAPLTVSRFNLTGTQFTDGNPQAPVTLQPGQQLTLTITFDPTTVGSDAETLTVTSNDPSGAATVSVGGAGTATSSPLLTVSPTSVDFGNVAVNNAVTEPVTLTSTGTAPVTVSAAAISGAGFAVSGGSFPLTLNPNQSVVLQVKFDPASAGAATGQLAVASDSSANPTVRVSLTGTGTVAATPQLAVSKTSLAFGDVTVNSTAALPLTLTSTGTAPVTVSAATLSGAGFKISGASFPLTLNPNQSVSLQAQFAPTSAGAASGQLAIASNSSSGSTTVVQLSGNGTAAPIPQLTVSAGALSFGNVTVGSTAKLPLTLTSTGTAPVTVNAATLNGDSFSDSGASFPVTLSPNQSVTLEVQFAPASAGPAAGQLTIASNSSTNGAAVVQLSGAGTVATSPQLTVSAASLSFGNVTVNATATLPLTLTSTGTAPVTVSAATISGAGFHAAGLNFPVTLNPNQSVTLQVQFDPTSAGAASGELTITSDSSSGGSAMVQLSGTGTVAAVSQLTVSAASLAFGNVTVGSAATLPLTLTSTGNAPVTVNAATLNGAGFSDSGASFPVTLNPNQSVTVQVQFAPTSAGPAGRQLTITSNSSSGTTNVVQLSGTGTAATSPQLTVSAASLAFGNVTVGSTATLPLTLTSSGTAPVTVNAATVSGAGFSDSGSSFPVTLNPNQSVTMQVAFNPSAAGGAAGQLTINSNSSSGSATVVQLSGAGTVPTVAQLTVSASSLAFGNVTVNSTATLPLTLSSTGTAPVTVSAAALSGAGFSESGAAFPMSLNPGQSITLQVAFDPTAAGADAGQITINSNSSSGGTAVVRLSGTGIAPNNPQLLVSTTALSFGSVPVGSTVTLNLTLSSTGTTPVTVNSAALSGAGFSESGGSFPVTLNPNQSVTLQVAFDPTAAGADAGQITVSSNSTTGGTVVVQLSGAGTAVAHEIDLSWGAPSSSSDPVAGYDVYRSTDGGASFAKVASVGQAQLSYADKAVQSGSTYVYEVKSVDANGTESDPSNQFSGSVP